MAALHAGDVFGFDDLDPVLFEAGDQGVLVLTPQRWVRLARWPEVFFHPQVQLHGAAGEPASSAGRELWGLRDLFHPQQVAEKAAGGRFLARRHGELNVIEAAEGTIRHAFMIGVDCP